MAASEWFVLEFCVLHPRKWRQNVMIMILWIKVNQYSNECGQLNTLCHEERMTSRGYTFLNMSRRSRLTTFHDLQLLVMLKSIVMRLVYVEWHYHKIHGYVSIYKSKEAHPVTRASRITAGTSPTTWCPQADIHIFTSLAFSWVISLHPKKGHTTKY
jgi:hypothetical protein